jgi:type II secretory pathway pseudopilin PulG
MADDEVMEEKSPKLNPTKKSTWLEIVIGTVILLSLSMAAMPYFARAAGRGRMEELSDRLYLVRCTIELYRNEHSGLLPGQQNPGQRVLPSDFVRDLTLPDMKGDFPYFERFPENPFIRCDDRRNTITCINDPNMLPDGTEGTAWWFNAATGQFRACDNKFHTAY